MDASRFIICSDRMFLASDIPVGATGADTFLFDLLLHVPVNIYGHVGTYYGNSIKHWDVIVCEMCLNITKQEKH